jgi:transposase-like protein
MKMANTLAEAIEILKHLPERHVEKALQAIREVKSEHDQEEKETIPQCPKCKSEKVVRNGKKRRKQAFLCRTCGKSFVETSETTLFYSHSGEAVWKQVIRDTVNGKSINKTATELDLHHETVFNMRHKILFVIEQEELKNPTKLTGVCEADETYILESYKGKKLPNDFWRKPRKHGAVATKPGLSNEYVCICTGIEREGNAVAVAVNRATAGKKDIEHVFSERVNKSTLILSDGAKGYSVLNDKCQVQEVNKDRGGFYNINTVNSYHSFIKERNRNARGFATKYINRYNSLFSMVFRKTDNITNCIYDLLCDMNNRYNTSIESRTRNLLEV